MKWSIQARCMHAGGSNERSTTAAAATATTTTTTQHQQLQQLQQPQQPQQQPQPQQATYSSATFSAEYDLTMRGSFHVCVLCMWTSSHSDGAQRRISSITDLRVMATAPPAAAESAAPPLPLTLHSAARTSSTVHRGPLPAVVDASSPAPAPAPAPAASSVAEAAVDTKPHEQKAVQ
jgi:hypothetical protein